MFRLISDFNLCQKNRRRGNSCPKKKEIPGLEAQINTRKQNWYVPTLTEVFQNQKRFLISLICIIPPNFNEGVSEIIFLFRTQSIKDYSFGLMVTQRSVVTRLLTYARFCAVLGSTALYKYYVAWVCGVISGMDLFLPPSLPRSENRLNICSNTWRTFYHLLPF